ncbi:LysM peptidoglycan-binding domain-containing protein [Actinomadura montaniterrae]|uniref:LysM peptidoglycan-binding domain-containing protein n=2 Tax=Actinomadura montaniterrae TaxID=1803903 RepID=A0A6L3VTG7_9ACTN|nr:LysM peptidoglycan-binding domain-containing protein [Actinomadura montaniterrae]
MIKQLFEDVLAFRGWAAVQHRTGVRSKIHSKSRRVEMPDSPSGERVPLRPERAPIRLTRRGRAVLVLIAAAVTLAALWLDGGTGAFAGGRADHHGRSGHVRTAVVEPGDTLWRIATDCDPGADPRVTVQRIIDLNGMGGDPTVQPGQRLVLPG